MARIPRQKITRDDLQALARLRIMEAQHLLNIGSSSGAYYLTGLAIECALKACIARSTQQYEFPDFEAVKNNWNHNLTNLLSSAGLGAEHQTKASAEAEFRANWLTIKDWDVSSRYQQRTGQEARDIVEAATNKTYGILPWIERYW
jgi:hypothetical protein